MIGFLLGVSNVYYDVTPVINLIIQIKTNTYRKDTIFVPLKPNSEVILAVNIFLIMYCLNRDVTCIFDRHFENVNGIFADYIRLTAININVNILLM